MFVEAPPPSPFSTHAKAEPSTAVNIHGKGFSTKIQVLEGDRGVGAPPLPLQRLWIERSTVPEPRGKEEGVDTVRCVSRQACRRRKGGVPPPPPLSLTSFPATSILLSSPPSPASLSPPFPPPPPPSNPASASSGYLFPLIARELLWERGHAAPLPTPPPTSPPQSWGILRASRTAAKRAVVWEAEEEEELEPAPSPHSLSTPPTDITALTLATSTPLSRLHPMLYQGA